VLRRRRRLPRALRALPPRIAHRRDRPRARAPAVLAHERDGATTYLLSDRTAVGFCSGDPPVPGGTCDLTASQPAFG